MKTIPLLPWWAMLAAQLTPQSVEAVPLRGELGVQSKATVTISASVLPRFQIDAKQPGGSVQLVTNAPRLHYSVVVVPAALAAERDDVERTQPPQERVSGAKDEPLLVLVVPE